MNENNTLEDDFTLGDVIKKKEEKRTRIKYIIIGISSFLILVAVVVIIVVIVNKKHSPNNNKEEDNEDKKEEEEQKEEEEVEDDEPKELSKIAVINCTFEIDITSSIETNILNEEYKKNSKFYIFIDGKKIKFSRKYKFEILGEHLVTFDIYEDINMGYMFKDIRELISVNMETENNIKIFSMKSTFENCKQLRDVIITGYSAEHLISTQRLFYNTDLSEFSFENLKNNIYSGCILYVCFDKY